MKYEVILTDPDEHRYIECDYVQWPTEASPLIEFKNKTSDIYLGVVVLALNPYIIREISLVEDEPLKQMDARDRESWLAMEEPSEHQDQNGLPLAQEIVDAINPDLAKRNEFSPEAWPNHDIGEVQQPHV